jgi:hypothetical protein
MLLDTETATLAAVGNQPVHAEGRPESAEDPAAVPQQQDGGNLIRNTGQCRTARSCSFRRSDGPLS